MSNEQVSQSEVTNHDYHMDICDENGNLCEDFLTRLDKLKTQQAENVRLLDSMRIDSQIEQKKRNEVRQSTSEVDEQIQDMWRDFDLTQRIIDLKQYDDKRDIHAASDYCGAVARASGTHWTPIVTVPRPFSMTIRAEAGKEPRHTRASLEVEKARIEREEVERQMIEAKRQFKGSLYPQKLFCSSVSAE